MSNQSGLGSYGFGALSTVLNPVTEPLPVFGPKGPPAVKRGLGSLKGY